MEKTGDTLGLAMVGGLRLSQGVPTFQLVFALAFGAAAWGQTTLDIARRASAELHADAVIKLVQRGEAPASLLDEAFQAAKQAKEPVRLIAAPDAPNGRPQMREAALRPGLDRLSLETRVVMLLAAKDPDRARKMFESIDRPQVEARPCQDSMIVEDSAYFDTAAKIGANFIAVAGPGNSPGDLPGIANLILANKGLTRDEFRMQLGALGLKMEMAAPDYREFAVIADQLEMELDALTARAQDLVVPVDPIVQGARKLAITQTSEPRCHAELRGALGFVDWFNHQFGKKYDPIERAETMPKGDLGSPVTTVYFASSSAQELMGQFQQLRAARGKPEWSERLTGFLAKFAEWKPEGAAIDVFHQKMIVLHGLYQTIPEGEDRDKLAAQAIELLKSGGIEQQFPAEWEYQMQSFGESALNGRAKLLAAFRDSQDAGLKLFAALNPSQ
jgi:hypothetical protein